jgi:TolA-binding protein
LHRISLPFIVALAACATAQKPSPAADDLHELRSQLDAQSALVAQQQRRIEELEVKLAALAARAQQPPPQAPAAVPATAKEPRPALKTVKLGEGKGRRPSIRNDRSNPVIDRDRANPVDRAPRISSAVALKEPDDDAVDRLEADQEVAKEFTADRAWAKAVRELNDGQHADAERDFLAFAAENPHHSAADNALALAGLAREVRGDCKGALPLFESVATNYPAGDAVPQSMLERGRCLSILGRGAEAKPVLEQLVHDHPEAAEAEQARRLLERF